MLTAIYSTKFKKDIKLMGKRGLNLTQLKKIMNDLENEKPLQISQQDHLLTGNYIGYRECHIEPDWLLIYKIDKITKNLYFTRTGTHSDLF